MDSFETLEKTVADFSPEMQEKIQKARLCLMMFGYHPQVIVCRGQAYVFDLSVTFLHSESQQGWR